jgi:hypothetical protein
MPTTPTTASLKAALATVTTIERKENKHPASMADLYVVLTMRRQFSIGGESWATSYAGKVSKYGKEYAEACQLVLRATDAELLSLASAQQL